MEKGKRERKGEGEMKEMGNGRAADNFCNLNLLIYKDKLKFIQLWFGGWVRG